MDKYSRLTSDAQEKYQYQKYRSRRNFLGLAGAGILLTFAGGTIGIINSCSETENKDECADSLDMINYGDEDNSRQVAKINVDTQPSQTVGDLIEKYYGNLPLDVALRSIAITNDLSEDDLNESTELPVDKEFKIYITHFEEMPLDQQTSINDVSKVTGCSEEMIAEVNNVEVEDMLSGVIRLPRQSAIQGGKAVIVEKDSDTMTYWSMSQSKGVDVANILAFNPMDPGVLQPGQIVILPDTEVAMQEPNPNISRDQMLIDFVNSYGTYAEMVEVEYGVPADLTLAQAVVESSYGQSELATNAFNFHGIKDKEGDPWQGDWYEKKTWESNGDGTTYEVLERFRQYDSVDAGFRGYGEKLHEGYYEDAFSETDPHEFFNRLIDENGPKYATDQEYSEKIHARIDEVSAIRHPEISTVEPETSVEPESVAERIAQINPTPDGYHAFTKSIDETMKGVAEENSNFNGDLIPSIVDLKMFVLHYTALYYNGIGTGHGTDIPVPYENNDGQETDQKYPEHLMTSMRNAGSTGIQYFIDRNGKTWHLTNARCWHCLWPSYFSEGVEIEATTQEAITSQQYEAAIYLAAHVILEQGLLDNDYPLDDILVGHNALGASNVIRDVQSRVAPEATEIADLIEETQRTEYQNPVDVTQEVEVNSDFPGEATSLLREKVRELLSQMDR